MKVRKGVARTDLFLMRRLGVAYELTRGLAAADDYAGTLLEGLAVARGELEAAAHAEYLEELDDPPVFADQEAAAGRLREALVSGIRRARVVVEVESTDEFGEVVKPDAIARFEAFAEGFVDGDRGSNLPTGGVALKEVGGLMAEGLEGMLGAGHPICVRIAAARLEFEVAQEKVRVEDGQIRAARERLFAARWKAQETLRVARALVELMRLLHPELKLNRTLIFPPVMPGERRGIGAGGMVGPTVGGEEGSADEETAPPIDEPGGDF